MRMRSQRVLLILLAFSVLASTNEGAADVAPMQPTPLPPAQLTDRLIIKIREEPSSTLRTRTARIGARLRTLSVATGTLLSYFRTMSNGAVVATLPERMSVAEARAMAERLSLRTDIEYAEPDLRVYPHRVPNDPLFSQQWHYQSEAGGMRLPGAWDITTGNTSIVVAVVDTGILRHRDLAGRVLPGYDFISDPNMANDGDGRDNNPADPGDWVTAEESGAADGPFEGCPVSDSSWHGTHVAGTIGGASNNGIDVTGIDWAAKVLPVRVLGKCGGFISDIVDGMRWAAGLFVSGVPNNPRPAQVLNLSLGGQAPCSVTLQTALDEIVGAGATIITSAGNAGIDASLATPANCRGVISVAATIRGGSKAFYSNFGRTVTVSAPGGQQLVQNEPSGILSTLNRGRTAPGEDDVRFYQGTSQAAANATGVVSLMLSVDPDLTPARIRETLIRSARPFTAGTGCDNFICGAGIVDAEAAVRAAMLAGQNIDYFPFAVNNVQHFDSLLIVTNPVASNSSLTACTISAIRPGERCLFNVQLDPYQVKTFNMPEIGLANAVGQIRIFTPKNQPPLMPSLLLFNTSNGKEFTLIPPTP